MWQRRFVCDDRDVHDRRGKKRDVRRKKDQELGKRVSRLRDADLVQPDDVVVRIRHLGAVMIEMRNIRSVMVVRSEVTVSDRGVMIGGIRLVHVFGCDRRRQHEPGRKGRRREDPSERLHPPRLCARRRVASNA